MKKIILIFFILTNTFSFCQEEINLEKASDNIQKIIDYKLDSYKPNIFISDIETIDSIVNLTKKKYKIILSFSDKCHFCTEEFPILTRYIKDNSDKFELFPVIGHKNKEIAHFIEYLKKIKYFKPMYLLDIEKYGTNKNPFKRIDQLTQKLCKECDYKKMGFCNFYVLNNNNKVVAHNNWDFKWEEQLKQLKKLVSKE